MIKLAKRRTLCTWIAFLAVLFSALAPTVSRAMAASSTPASLLEICTMAGYKVIQSSIDDTGKAPASSKLSMDHCAYCGSHGGGAGLPPALPQTCALTVSRDIHPPLFYAAPQPLHVWSAASPRAPPFLA